MKSFLIERVSNGWIVRPYGSEVRDDHTQASVFNTLPDLIGALPVLLAEPVVSDVCPPGIQMDIKPQWHADKSPPHLDAKPAHLFLCPDCGKYMSHGALDTWSCHRCATQWIRANLTPLQAPTPTDPPHCCSSGPEE